MKPLDNIGDVVEVEGCSVLMMIVGEFDGDHTRFPWDPIVAVRSADGSVEKQVSYGMCRYPKQRRAAFYRSGDHVIVDSGGGRAGVIDRVITPPSYEDMGLPRPPAIWGYEVQFDGHTYHQARIMMYQESELLPAPGGGPQRIKDLLAARERERAAAARRAELERIEHEKRRLAHLLEAPPRELKGFEFNERMRLKRRAGGS